MKMEVTDQYYTCIYIILAFRHDWKWQWRSGEGMQNWYDSVHETIRELNRAGMLQKRVDRTYIWTLFWG